MRKFYNCGEEIEKEIPEQQEAQIDATQQLAYLLGSDESDILEGRIILLNSEIDDKVLETVGAYILKCNQEDKGIPVEEREHIRLLINSPGGCVLAGSAICSLIKLSETKVDAVVLGKAESMGFLISIVCDTVYSLPTSIFLLHDGSMALDGLSTSKFYDTTKGMEKMHKMIKQMVIENTNITSREYNRDYRKENYYTAEEAKKKGIVDKIIGVDCKLSEIL